MSSPSRKPILITGSHRSGSTWIGRIMASASGVRYVHEPFNLGRRNVRPPLRYWYEYMGRESNNLHQKEVLDYVASFCTANPRAIQKTVSFFKSPIAFLKEWRSRSLRRTLLKDPLALFSAAWLYHHLPCEVLVSIRHPAAFIASLKVKNWNFPFQHFAKQESLINGWLKEYAQEIEEAANAHWPIVDQGILLWNCIYSVVKQYQDQYQNDWYFVKHEDLSRNPEEEFQKIMAFFHLKWEKSIVRKIQKTTHASSQTEHTRDAKENIHSWKNRLSTEEITKIKEKTVGVWTHFYTEADW
ncbi:MAG: sulfotransferase [Flavobacteriaceae bacterium]